jgi:MYXO-CTERM domain-containing protein
VPPTTSTTIAQLCKPGNGYGDKNHCHSGPPGQNKNNGDTSFSAKLANYVRPNSPSGAALIALLAVVALFALSPIVRRRRN